MADIPTLPGLGGDTGAGTNAPPIPTQAPVATPAPQAPKVDKPFDYQGAKKAGYSDAEIAGHLAKSKNFDVEGARKAGYSDKEILQHLGVDTKGTAKQRAQEGLKNIRSEEEKAIEMVGVPEEGIAAKGAAKVAPLGAGIAKKVGSAIAKSTVGKLAEKALTNLAKTIDPEVAKLAAKAKEMGFNVNVHDLTDNKVVNFLKEHMTSGDPAKHFQATSNKNLIKEIGGDPNATKLTHEVYADAMDKTGSLIGDTAKKVKSMPIYEDTAKSVSPLSNEIKDQLTDASKFKTDHTYKVINNYADEIYGKVTTPTGKKWDSLTSAQQAKSTPVLSGEVMQNYISKIGKEARSTNDPELKTALNKLHDTLLDHVERNLNPSDVSKWKEARTQYAKGKTLEGLVAKHGDVGNIPPKSIKGATIATKAGKAAVAKGKGGSLADLGSIGQRFEPETPKDKHGLSAVVGVATHGLSTVLKHVTGNLYDKYGPKIATKAIEKSTGMTLKQALKQNASHPGFIKRSLQSRAAKTVLKAGAAGIGQEDQNAD
jgi:hypothetical protein